MKRGKDSKRWQKTAKSSKKWSKITKICLLDLKESISGKERKKERKT
jgi:hypothetical protein